MTCALGTHDQIFLVGGCCRWLLWFFDVQFKFHPISEVPAMHVGEGVKMVQRCLGSRTSRRFGGTVWCQLSQLRRFPPLDEPELILCGFLDSSTVVHFLQVSWKQLSSCQRLRWWFPLEQCASFQTQRTLSWDPSGVERLLGRSLRSFWGVALLKNHLSCVAFCQI
jgi:hypothetical protein